jgi:hypothetical protein
MPQS